MSARTSALNYAVRFRVCAKYIGQLCLALAALTIVPLTVSLAFGDFSISLRYGVVMAGLAWRDFFRRGCPRPSGSSQTKGWSWWRRCF